MTTAQQTVFTTSAYVRSHSTEPRGQGGWGFQESRTEAAFDSDRFGPVVWVYGTYAEARRQARDSFPAGACVAVMP